MARRRSSVVEEIYEMLLDGMDRGVPSAEGSVSATLHSSRGDVECRYYPATNATGGAIFVGGAGGGFDTPVRGFLHPRLCQELQQGGIAALRVRYRHPADLAESTLDVLAGLHFIQPGAHPGVDKAADVLPQRLREWIHEYVKPG